jgi:hypothetical protein
MILIGLVLWKKDQGHRIATPAKLPRSTGSAHEQVDLHDRRQTLSLEEAKVLEIRQLVRQVRSGRAYCEDLVNPLISVHWLLFDKSTRASTVNLLIPLVSSHDEDPVVRVLAAVLLGGLADPNVVRVLRQAVLDTDDESVTALLGLVFAFKGMDDSVTSRATIPDLSLAGMAKRYNGKQFEAFWEGFLWSISKRLGFDKDYEERVRAKYEGSSWCPQQAISGCLGDITDSAVRAKLIDIVRRGSSEEYRYEFLRRLRGSGEAPHDLIPLYIELASDPSQPKILRMGAITQLQTCKGAAAHVEILLRKELTLGQQSDISNLDNLFMAYSSLSPEDTWGRGQELARTHFEFLKSQIPTPQSELALNNFLIGMAAARTREAQLWLCSIAASDSNVPVRKRAIEMMSLKPHDPETFQTRLTSLSTLLSKSDVGEIALQSLVSLAEFGKGARRKPFQEPLARTRDELSELIKTSTSHDATLRYQAAYTAILKVLE